MSNMIQQSLGPEKNVLRIFLKFYIGGYAEFNEKSIQTTQAEFQHSCNLMEFDAAGTTTNSSKDWSDKIIIHDGVVYSWRELRLSVAFLSRIFMNIEQKVEYTG